MHKHGQWPAGAERDIVVRAITGVAVVISRREGLKGGALPKPTLTCGDNGVTPPLFAAGTGSPTVLTWNSRPWYNR